MHCRKVNISCDAAAYLFDVNFYDGAVDSTLVYDRYLTSAHIGGFIVTFTVCDVH
jgi:hypothetical protein